MGGKIVIGAAAVGMATVALALVALLRMEESRRFTEDHRVHLRNGTNYVIRLLETAVGRSDSGYVLIVYARLENPNPYEVVLRRDRFALADQARNYLRPTTDGTQAALIKLPANGVRDREMFSFDLPTDALRGRIQLTIGGNNWVLIKNEKPFTRELRSGQFVSFRTDAW
jgi:hypothetical protein